MKIRISFWDDAPHCGALERLLPIHNFPRAGIAEPSLSSQMFLLTYLGNVLYVRQGWTGKLFFSRGGEGQGQKSMGRGGAGNPPFPTVQGGARKGSKSAGLAGAGAGNILCVLIEIICCSKEISICIALSEVNLLNIHNLDRNHN